MSERITIVIETGNDAFEQPATEIARILRHMADSVEQDGHLPSPRDLNGNLVGSATVCSLPTEGE